MARVPTFSPWENLATQPDNTGIEGDQINPAVMAQMAQQAQGAPQGPAPVPQAPEPPPEITPVEQAPQPVTAMPTTQPLGAMPQELPPQPQNTFAVGMPPLKDQLNIADNATGGFLQQQGSDIAALRDQLAKYQATPRQTDWRPLAALVDTQFGGGGAFGKAAQAIAPESEAEKQKTINSSLKDIATLSGGLTKEQREYYKEKLNEQSYELNRQLKERLAQEANKTKIAAANPVAKYREARLDLATSKNAGDVGSAYEKDKILKDTKTSANSLLRSESILTNREKPVTTTDLNLAYNDYINAVAAGGAATEGKIQREMPVTFETEWNRLKQKAGRNEDLRKSPTGAALIDLLQKNITKVKEDLNAAKGEQAYNIHSNFMNSTNPKAIETNKRKLKEYAPEKYNELYGGSSAEKEVSDEDAAAVDWAKKNSDDPRAQQILKMHGM